MTASLTIRSARVSPAIVGAVAGMLVSLSGPLAAQAYSTRAAMPPAAEITPTPVAPSPSGYRVTAGERAIYDVELRGHGVGTGSFEVLGHEEVDGRTTVHASLQVK